MGKPTFFQIRKIGSIPYLFRYCSVIWDYLCTFKIFLVLMHPQYLVYCRKLRTPRSWASYSHNTPLSRSQILSKLSEGHKEAAFCSVPLWATLLTPCIKMTLKGTWKRKQTAVHVLKGQGVNCSPGEYFIVMVLILLIMREFKVST